MIVPSVRLIWIASIVLPLLAALTAVSPDAMVLCAALLAVMIAAAVAVAAIAQRRLTEVAVQAPPELRMTRDTGSVFALGVANRGSRPVILRVGVVLPETIRGGPEIQDAALPGRSQAQLTWTCTGERHGEYLLDTVHVEAGSPLGLWQVRESRAIQCHFRVFPNLRGPEAQALLRHEPGARLDRYLGHGREFEKLRDYAPGDSYESVHWKATARRGRPVIKQYQVEHAQEIYLAVDQSRLTAREQVLEHYTSAALHMALAAERCGDRFGIATFSDRAHKFLRPRSGPEHFRACRETVYNLRPRSVNPDFREVFASMHTSIRRRSLVAFFTVLDDPLLAETFDREISVLSRRNVVLVFSMRTQAAQPVFDGEPPRTLEQAYTAVAGQMLWNRLKTVQVRLRNKGVYMHVVTPQGIRAQVGAAYLEIKRRQLL